MLFRSAYRGMADALIVSGTATGKPTNPADLLSVRKAVPDRPILIGSGATPDTIVSLLSCCDGVIVGSSLKAGGRIDNPIDPDLARQFVKAARS